MLWIKEANERSALYVDIFSGFEPDGLMDREYHFRRNTVKNTLCEKNFAISFEKLLDGNKSFAKGDWLSAWGMYNDSLCYAEPGSTTISFAYANRSVCFFQLKKYAECVVDIELAENAGYPAHLMPELKKFQDYCLKLIEEGAQQPDDRLKLSFEPDEHFPCMANVLNIEKNAKGIPIMVAKEDIEVGKIIAAEKSLATCVYSKYGWRCNICLKDCANLLPCKSCNFAMFCSKECQASLVHKYECGLRFTKNTQHNGIIMNEVRMVFKAIEMFPDVNELMTFVEQAVQSDPNEIPDTISDEKSKYKAFLQLPFNSTWIYTNDFWLITYPTYRMLMDTSKINEIFKPKKYNRFLMHLVGQHCLVMNKNSLRMTLSSIGSVPINTDRRDICTHTSLIKRYFAHSCVPNVLWIDCNGYSVYIMVRPVKRGEQLFNTMFDLVLEPKEKRQKFLWERENFHCKCTLCTGPSATPEQRQQLLSDPFYRKCLVDDEYYAAFLQKYGNSPLCDEIREVLNGYCTMIRSRYIGLPNCRAWAEIITND